MRSLVPLVLGALYALCLYRDDCRWFHGCGFFRPSAGCAARRTSTSTGRWRPWRPLLGGGGRWGGGAQPLDVKDFGDLLGYAPLLLLPGLGRQHWGGGGRQEGHPVALAKEVLEALAEWKTRGGGGALKVRLLLAIADRRARP